MPRELNTALVRPRARRKPNPVLLRAVYKALREGCGIELACQSEGIDPNDFEQWMQEDESVRRRVVRECALFERGLIVKSAAGGKTMCQSRASLELLSRISTRYTHKTQVSVRSGILQGAQWCRYRKKYEPNLHAPTSGRTPLTWSNRRGLHGASLQTLTETI